MKLSEKLKILTPFDRGLWIFSVLSVTICFFLLPERDPISLIASLIGVSALILNAKRLVAGPVLLVFFALMYAFISYESGFYGEMIRYLCLGVPMSALSALIWSKNRKSDSLVSVGRLTRRHLIILLPVAAAVGCGLYFLLRHFGTELLILNTLGALLNFIASCFNVIRTPLFGVTYALCDIVSICIWAFKSTSDISCLPMVICFAVFLINDMYAFINWTRARKN